MSESLLGELEAECASYQALLEILGRERDALRRADAREVEAMAHEKQGALLLLSQFARQRSDSLRSAGLSNDAAGMRDWISASAAPELLLATWKRIQALVTESQRRNELNGQLIDMQRRYFSLALNALLGVDGSKNCYGADGFTRISHQPRQLAAI